LELPDGGWKELQRVVEEGITPPHDPRKVDALAKVFSEFRRQRVPLDLLLVTGDLATDGSEQAMGTAKAVLDGDIRQGPTNRLVYDGVRVPAERRIVLPGNHDRYRSKVLLSQDYNNTFLEEHFGKRGEYPYVVGYRRPEYRSDSSAPTLVFFVFDSTPSPAAVGTREFRRNVLGYGYNMAASGKVERAECRRLLELASELDHATTVPGWDGEPLEVTPDAVVRVVLLHHHPLISKQARWETGLVNRLKRSMSLLVDGDEFVESCLEARMDLVLFGHEHLFYRRARRTQSGHRTYFFCCPTATCVEGSDTGFYMFHFHPDRFVCRPFQYGSSSSGRGRFAFVEGLAKTYPYASRSRQPATPV
jgi:3',5'-cyclic AMP phosphodiesterase CpdA